MNEQQVAALAKLAEESAALAIEAQVAAQRIVMAELLDTLKKQGVLNDNAIMTMLGRLDAIAAKLAITAPSTAEALADTALSLGNAFGDDSGLKN